MGRRPCCSKEGLNRGAWTAHEDKILIEYIRVHGEGRWRNVPKSAGLKRCGKSCRLRWLNYLRPDIKRGNISKDEEELIIRLHNLLGNRWSLIAGRLPGRTDNEIKNYWNTNLGKRVKSAQSDAKSTENPNATSKCSMVLFNNSLPHSSSMQLHNKSKAEDVVSNNSPMEPNDDNNGFLSFINEEEKQLISTDLLREFKEGDTCLSELLNSDFSNTCHFSYNEDLLTPCSDQLPVFSDEILKDWTQSNFATDDETNATDNLCSFS